MLLSLNKECQGNLELGISLQIKSGMNAKTYEYPGLSNEGTHI